MPGGSRKAVFLDRDGTINADMGYTMPGGSRKAVFLDRDGTINADRGYLYRPEDFVYLDGAVEGMRCLAGMGYLLVVVTNQSGIARGYYTEQEYLRLEEWMRKDLSEKGIELSGIYHCPHHPEGAVPEYRVKCRCRKPGTALFWRAQRELDIDMDQSFAVGDKPRDLAICGESGVRGILLSDDAGVSGGFDRCESWGEIVRKIQSCEGQGWQRSIR